MDSVPEISELVEVETWKKPNHNERCDGRGEIMADDVVVNGRVIGRVRGLKVRLTSTARVEGDIIHKTIAIESGAHFEGSVQRQDDPLTTGTGGKAKMPEPKA